MDFKLYQTTAKETAIYPDNMKILYPALGLADEVGEVMGKIKKVYRDNGGVFSEYRKTEIQKEIGDVLWYLAALCSDLDMSLNEAAAKNLDKLRDRAERGKLQGSGDNR